MSDLQALPRPIAGLRSDDWQERFDATFALAQMGEDARAAVPALMDLLTDADLLLRKMAVVALGAIGPDARQAVPTLIEVLLHAEEPSVRRLAAVSLGQIDAQECFPALEQASEEDEDDDVRVTAAEALEEIESGENKAAA